MAGANAAAGEDRIEFAVSGRIELRGEPITVRDALVIDGDNDGDARPDVTVDANGLPRAFRALAELDVRGVTVEGESGNMDAAPRLVLGGERRPSASTARMPSTSLGGPCRAQAT